MSVRKLVQSCHPYISRRGNGYCFRFVLPRHVRQLCPELPTEIKRTLKTDSFSEAVVQVNGKTDLIVRIKQSRDSGTLTRLCASLASFDDEREKMVAASLKGAWAWPQAAGEVPVGKPEEVVGTPLELQSPTLSQAWTDFVAWKNWTTKRAGINVNLMDNLLFFLGDVQVHTITKRDLRVALESIRGLPQRNRGPYRGKSLQEISRMEIPEEHRVADKTVKEHLKLCQSLFSAYLVKERELLQVSPTDNLRLEVEDQRFACLGDAQVLSVLEKARKKPEWVRWFLLIAAYSGARRSEIARLCAEDFKTCPDTGRHYFVVKTGKTKAARRIVPIHRTLLAEGLLDWVREIDGPLFGIVQANLNRITDHFGSLVGEKTNDLGERLVFHSLRHTFITKSRSAGASTVLVQQVVGHEKRGAGITDRYTHSFPLRDVLPVVDLVSYQRSPADHFTGSANRDDVSSKGVTD